MSEAWIIGSDNPHSGDPGRALEVDVPGSAGRRLLEMSGMPEARYLASFRRANACDHPQPPNGATIVVLGRLAWATLNLPFMHGWFDPVVLDGRTWVLVPHPSGLNLMYNEEENRIRLRSILTAAASRAA